MLESRIYQCRGYTCRHLQVRIRVSAMADMLRALECCQYFQALWCLFFLSWVSIYSFPQEAEDWKYAVHALRIPATETSHPDSPHKVVRILEQAKRQLLIKEATSHAWTAIFSYLQNIIYVKADLAGAAYVAWGQSWTQYTRVNHERVTRVKIASLGCKTSRGTIIKSSFIVVFVFVTKLMTTVFL